MALETKATYDTLLQAGLRKLRLSGAGASDRLARSTKAAGVRTSGVGMIPRIASAQARQLGEADLIQNAVGMRLGQIGAQENIKLQGSINRDLLLRRLQEERAMSREANAAATRNALIGGGAGAFGSFAKYYF